MNNSINNDSKHDGIEDVDLETSKLIHKLSVDHQYAKKQFNKLIKKYESNKKLCGKYFFGIWIDIYIPKETDKNYKIGKFEFKDISCSFLLNDQNKMDKIELDVFYDLNSLDNYQKNDIILNYKNFINLNLINSNIQTNSNYLFIIPNLINMFYTKGYEFLLIPTTCDFNKDVGLVHQCLILINLKEGIIIFYEPYLSYKKYDHDYSYTIQQFFQIYKNSLPKHFILENTVKYKNYTDYFNISQDNGLQSIILNKNNTKKSEFDIKYNSLMETLKISIPKLYEKVKSKQEHNNNPVNATDNTIKILDVIYYFEKWELELKFPKIYDEILYMYGLYNSKSCVSLSLIEINNIFSSENSLKNLYKNVIDSEYPNKIVISELKSFHNSK